MELGGELGVLGAELGEGCGVGGAGGEGLDSGAEGFEGAGDLGGGRWVGGYVEGEGALAFEKGEFDVVGEEEELGRIRHFKGCEEGVSVVGCVVWDVLVREVYSGPRGGLGLLG